MPLAFPFKPWCAVCNAQIEYMRVFFQEDGTALHVAGCHGHEEKLCFDSDDVESGKVVLPAVYFIEERAHSNVDGLTAKTDNVIPFRRKS
jgi:hypothetical protein